ncbi:MAG: BCCT family transporter, partial [Salegentibacter sp.]
MKKIQHYLLRQNILFNVSAILLFSFSLIIFFFTEDFYDLIDTASIWVREFFGEFYLWLGLLCVLFLLFIALSRFGRIRLGA